MRLSTPFFTMKKILTALMLLCAVALNAQTAPQKGEVQENVTKTEVLAVSGDDGSKVVVAETSTVSEKGDVSKAAKQKLTPEQRNKRIKDADGAGIGITLMSMAIVILALVVLSILFMIFGKISQKLHRKKKMETYGLKHDDDNHEAASGEAMAAIAAAVYQHFNSRHDIEDTVLTMRKLKRAYSPWSSKLYGLRQVPQRDIWHR